jgi:hypothetical protein
MAKAKWFKFKLGKREKITLLIDGVSDAHSARIVSVIVDEDRVPTGEFVIWEEIQLKPSPGKLEISGVPPRIESRDAKVRKASDGDLIGDLNVTVQFPTAPSESISVSTVSYSP